MVGSRSAKRASEVLCCAALCWLAAPLAGAQVIEPNGLAVPVPPVTNGERSVQAYFEDLMPPEPIDAVADAAAEPATFSPLCGFEAELVMSESQSPAGLAWYNVPSDPTAAPDALYPVLAETTLSGATISSSAIREHPSYAGGLVGFALTKFGGRPIYFSEPMRNFRCSACAAPGHWILMLAYPSSFDATTYYLAWEDWEGANENSWPNDGDFNDKVFRLSGVRCAGGGEPCETGRPGVCARGLTDCGSDGRSCKQVVPEVAEICDAFDNDCDGAADEGDPCPRGTVCTRGACTRACGGEEFGCPPLQTCDEGRCVEAACYGVRCESGKACRKGECIAPCDGIVCPAGHECASGVCVDPCAGVQCSAGGVCRGGACVEACNCAGCPAALACDRRSGLCVDPGCENRACEAGQRCIAGACSDPCEAAVCPGGAACVNGACEGSEGALAGRAAPRPPDAGRGGAGGAGATAGRAGPPGSIAGAGARTASEPSGCGCRAHGARAAGARAWLWLLAAFAAVLGSRFSRSARRP